MSKKIEMVTVFQDFPPPPKPEPPIQKIQPKPAPAPQVVQILHKHEIPLTLTNLAKICLFGLAGSVSIIFVKNPQILLQFSVIAFCFYSGAVGILNSNYLYSKKSNVENPKPKIVEITPIIPSPLDLPLGGIPPLDTPKKMTLAEVLENAKKSNNTKIFNKIQNLKNILSSVSGQINLEEVDLNKI